MTRILLAVLVVLPSLGFTVPVSAQRQPWGLEAETNEQFQKRIRNLDYQEDQRRRAQGRDWEPLGGRATDSMSRLSTNRLGTGNGPSYGGNLPTHGPSSGWRRPSGFQ